jgi:hypothetical protein
LGQQGWDYLTIKYSPQGDSLWVKRFNPVTSSNDEPVSVVPDNFQNIYVTGKSDRLLFNRISTVVYSPSGDAIHLLNYDTTQMFRNHEPVRMTKDSSGSVYIAGISQNSSGKWDMLILKYSALTGISQISSTLPDKFDISQNYPNPFNSQTKIQFSIPKKSNTEIYLYNTLGQKVSVIFKKELPEGSYEINFDSRNLSSGVYFYQFKINEELIKTKQMVIIK